MTIKINAKNENDYEVEKGSKFEFVETDVIDILEDDVKTPIVDLPLSNVKFHDHVLSQEEIQKIKAL